MLKKQRAQLVLDRLTELYPETPVPLNHSNHFELLVAVLLSAQCTDERVNQVTPALFKLGNSANAMQHVAVDDIYHIVRPCGLALQKSKAISNLLIILVENYNGEVPEDMAALETLPGVGHKTASVVMSQGVRHPAFPVDTHIHRLAQRWGKKKKKSVTQTERDLKKLFPKESWNSLHLQIIFYGREFCSARGCDGRVCDICTSCYPNRKKPFIAKKP